MAQCCLCKKVLLSCNGVPRLVTSQTYCLVIWYFSQLSEIFWSKFLFIKVLQFFLWKLQESVLPHPGTPISLMSYINIEWMSEWCNIWNNHEYIDLELITISQSSAAANFSKFNNAFYPIYFSATVSSCPLFASTIHTFRLFYGWIDLSFTSVSEVCNKLSYWLFW